MKIHEYQAKGLFASFGIPIPEGQNATAPEQARRAAQALGPPVVVKAQIYAGGRGKAGGVKVATSVEEAEGIASDLLGRSLVTHQTGPLGQPVKSVLVEKSTAIKDEIYLGVVIDRKRRAPVLMLSPTGGVDIEETAKTDPELIFKEWVDPIIGLQGFQAYRLAGRLGLDVTQTRRLAKVVSALYKLFVDKDCLLAEINPLIIDDSGETLAIDAKLNLDDNALYRHQEIAGLRDPGEEAPLELAASSYNLNYIKLDGNVGCLVNGAGLAMATMDLIKLSGAAPANFLDVGGGANEEMIENGFRILLSDQDVKVVFVNIFGGILRCDILAEGIVKAAKKMTNRLPVVIRLEGTNVEEGRRILKDSGLEFAMATDLEAAGQMVAQAVGKEDS